VSRFTGPLRIEEIEPGRQWRLIQPIIYEAGAKGSGRVITVPAGMETDGASIPALLRIFMAVWGSYGRAAALHDYGYRCLRLGDPHPEMPTRRICDQEFHTAMLACGTSPALAWLMWAAVRLGGARYSAFQAGIEHV
jgi:hypothetical protein